MIKQLLTVAFSCIATGVYAKELPKWEVGVGLGSQTLADYRGSSHYKAYFIPIPLITYRGEFLQADDDGIRGLFFNSERFELDISMAGSLSGVSDENPLRAGMPDLHPTGEIGPSVNINISGHDFSEGWSLRLPLRAVYAFDMDEVEVDHIGYLANPQFTYEGLDWQAWSGSLDLGLLYGSESYHNYFYRVPMQFATAERPIYEPNNGYSGSYFSFSMSTRQDRLWYGGYLRYDNLSGVTFADSPLVETDHYFTLGLGISWIVRQSSELVSARN